MVKNKTKLWDDFLDGALWAYRTTYKEATEFTPFHLVYGQEDLQPIELNIPTMRLHGKAAQRKEEEWTDRLLTLAELEWKWEAAYECYKRKATQVKDKLDKEVKDKGIKEGDLVLRYDNRLDNCFNAKFETRWQGPYIVEKAFNSSYYQLMDLNGKEHPRKVNGYRLKPYLSRILPKDLQDQRQKSTLSHKSCSLVQDWESGKLICKNDNHKKVVFDMKEQRQEELHEESSQSESYDDWTNDTSKEESSGSTTDEESPIEVMGVQFRPNNKTRHQGLEEVSLHENQNVLDEEVLNVVVTPKKNGKWRVCVDYRSLNEASKRDHFLLPFQDEILNEVAGKEKYTVCDDYSGYFQIGIALEDQLKTTFITPWGCFAFRVMPFGLTNAPATFQCFMNMVFQEFFGKSIRVFIDDFCIYSSKAIHPQKVEEGLKKLYDMGGQLNPDKCHIGEDEVILLGHKVSYKGIEVDPSKAKALIDLPSPKSLKEVISFVQKVKYMLRFIHLASELLHPLQRLTQQV
ncbi:hypothetical protein L7F22_056290 [Adiantum nelumboides]|nr:hypothetical protein [Adiantum nelumboides]